MTNKITVIQQ